MTEIRIVANFISELCPGNSTNDPTTQRKCSLNGTSVDCQRNQAPGTQMDILCKIGFKFSAKSNGSKSLTCLEGGKWSNEPIECLPICGRPTAKSVAYVIGGETTNITEVPWAAAIYQLGNGKFEYICGGTILTSKIILSAAHCFFVESSKSFQSPDQYKVAVGKNVRDLNGVESFPSQKFNLTKIVASPGYSGYSNFYFSDIVVLIIDGSINFEPHIVPICIDWDVDTDLGTGLAAGEVGMVAGWGFTEAEGLPSDTLKSIKMPVIDFFQCLSESGHYKNFVTYDKFCSGYKNGSGVCRGTNFI